MKKPFKRPPSPRCRPTKRAAPVKPAFYTTLQTDTPAPDKRFVFKSTVLERVGGVSYPTLWRWMRDGKFPMAVQVVGRCAWLESDIDQWMSSRPVRQYKKAEEQDQ